jgi:hypothetical protein
MSTTLTGMTLMVPQDYAHHIQSEPIETLGEWVLFPWPIPLPTGFDRVSTPLLTPARLAAMRLDCGCPDKVWPPVDPKPIPDPEPEPEPEEPQ